MESKYAKQRIINDIKNEDLQIQVTGYVKKINNDNTILLKDESGQLKIDLKDVDFNFNEGDLINVIGELRIITSGEKILDSLIIQDMNKLNFKYYQKLYEYKKELLEE
jgi:uncharacterized protein YdeI (BOF family)